MTATPDGNAVGISNEVKDKLPDAGGERSAADAALTPVFDQAPFVEKSIDGLTTEGLLGLVMAVLVILVFLLSVRSTLVTAVSIPLSVVVALIGLWIGDYSLNVLTLGALTIAVGRVVDDSIVVLENIKRHLSYGEDRQRGDPHRGQGGGRRGHRVDADDGRRLLADRPGRRPGRRSCSRRSRITVTVALLASLLVSLTVVPVLAYWFLKPAGDGADPEAVRREAEEKELQQPAATRLRAGHPASPPRRRWLTVGARPGHLRRHRLPGRPAEDQLLRPVRRDHAHRHPGAAGRHQPGHHRRGGARRSRRCSAGPRASQTYQVTHRLRRRAVRLRRRRRQRGHLLGDHRRRTSTVLELQDSLRQTLAALPDAGDIKVEAGRRRWLLGHRSSRSSSRPTTPQALRDGDRAGPRGGRRHARRRRRDHRPGQQHAADRRDRSTGRPPRAVGLTEAAIGQTVAAAFRGTPLGQLTLDGVAAERGAALRRRAGHRSTQLQGAAVADARPAWSRSARSPTCPRWTVRCRSPGSTAAAASPSAAPRPASNIGATTADAHQRLDGARRCRPGRPTASAA